MSSNDAPPPPDYSPIARAQTKMADQQYELSKEQHAWAKQVYAENKQVTDKVVARFLETQERNDAAAIADRERYERVFQPLEDDLAQEAQDYATPERRAKEMAKAQATVAQNFNAARINAQRNLESFGIDPSDTRYAALDVGVRAQQAAASAGAANQASDMVDATGRALRSEAINIGKGYPGQIAGTYNTALQAGSGANQQGLATTASGANTMGTGVQWGQMAGNNYTAGANTLNQGYQNQLSSAKYQQESDGQWFTLAGAAMGAGARMLAPRFAAEGGLIEGEEGTDGGVIPEQVSPSRGRAIDDVPARLTAGEFIIPKDVVEWYGQKHMYGLIEKADRERQEKKQTTGAIPKVHPSAMGAPGANPRQAIEVS